MTHENALICSLLQNAPSSVNTEAVFSQWQAVKNWFAIDKHTFPKPVWGQRGFEQNGAEAWQYLTRYVPDKQGSKAISIYIHVPFCESRCGFCDLLSRPLPKHNRHMEDTYAEALCKEMSLWASLKPMDDSPVTTVHFGGGTPTFLMAQILNRLVVECHNHFGLTAQTELAVESTSRALTEEYLAELQEMGFTRLHVGVQSLNDDIRRRIGRRETGDLVLQKIRNALDKGFIVSVDIIYGLPGQELKDLLTTLDKLTEIGVHGFSLYQLQICEKNLAFLKRQGAGRANPVFNYILFQVAEQYLRKKGYQKNFFTHFALPADKCLYYHHVKRGENLLALGPTADGVFDNYLYRHPDYDEYVTLPAPALQGGVMESVVEQKIRPVSAALMTAMITRDMFLGLDAEPLLDLWLACEMLKETERPGEYELSPNGSWFITQMLAQLKNRLNTHMENRC